MQYHFSMGHSVHKLADGGYFADPRKVTALSMCLRPSCYITNVRKITTLQRNMASKMHN